MRAHIFLAVVVSVLATGCNRVPTETPSDFAFVFKSQSIDVFTLDTFKGTYSKSTMSVEDAPIPFHLTQAQLDSIYTFMRDIDFFSLPEYLEPELDVKDFSSPWFTYNVRTNGVTKRVSFGGSITPGVMATQNLERLSVLITRMIMNSPEYQAMSRSTDSAFSQPVPRRKKSGFVYIENHR